MAEFTFTDEQSQLRAAVRKFCAENFDEQTVRRLMESDPPFDAKVWARLGSELGVLGLSVPEADGGAGGTLVDQAVAVEELGAVAGLRAGVRHRVPGDPRAGRGLGGPGARRAARRAGRGPPQPRRSPSPTGPARSIRRQSR